MPSILDTGKKAATAAALDQVDREKHGELAVDVTLEGAEASISTEKKGWGLTAYLKKAWKGKAVEAGARVTKRL
jgi:hypothetical protein